MRSLRLALAGLVVVTACGGGASKTASPPTTVAGSLPFFLPSFLPFGFGLVSGATIVEGPAHDAFAVAMGRPGERGEFNDVILLLVGEASTDREIGPNQQRVLRLVDVNGAQARVLESPVIGDSVDWFAHGLAVALSGENGSAGILLDVAKRLRLPTPGDASAAILGSPPDGYRVIAERHFVDRAPEQGRSLSISSEKGAAVSVLVTRVPLPLVFVVGGGDHLRPTRVRDREALISTRARQLPGGAPITQTTVAWHEADDVVVSISGSAPADILVPVAEGMGRVTEAEWRAAVPPGGGSP